MNRYELISKGFLIFCAFLTISITNDVFSQGLSGFVLNEKNEPIPFVNIYIKGSELGTSTDSNGKYYLTLPSGSYDIIYSSIGFETKSIPIVVTNSMIVKNIWLKPSSIELIQIVVRSKRKDPAYEIIQEVIDHKKEFLQSITSYRSQVYIKAAEDVEFSDKKKVKKDKSDQISDDQSPKDPFEEERIKHEQELQRYSMVEANLTLNFQQPNHTKEERTGYKSYGSKSGLFIPRSDKVNFNFYHNMVEMKGIMEVPVISPISRTAILSYKYKLEEVLNENGMVVYKIKVTPRKQGNSTCSGYLYINDGIWNINRLELNFDKGGIKFYDKFSLKQQYEEVEKGLWLPVRQELLYETKQGRSKTFKGSTIIRFNNFENNYPFPSDFFGNEVAVTSKEAYERDSSYWNSTRPEPLTFKEQEMVAYRDSISSLHNSLDYKDSIEAKYNRVTFGEIIFHGVSFRDHLKYKSYGISSIVNSINFEVIGGFRLGPYIHQFKRWKSGRSLWTSGTVNIGLQNKDVQGHGNFYFRYNPHKLADVLIRAGRSFYSVNSNDAYLNQLKISNYILHNHFGGFHKFEVINGLFFQTGAFYSDRQSVEGYNVSTVLNEVIDETDPLQFEGYQSFYSEVKLSYTPEQKYITEPTYKQILGSKYPTISVLHKKGWNGTFGSDVDYDYGEAEIAQKLILGVFGSSKYSLKAGRFFNTADLRYVDFKRFRQSDPYLYSDPSSTFQLLDSSLITTDWFVEIHHLHHFNGALMNNIPLIKKMRLHVVVGAGALWIKESNYRHEEIFTGLERVFKLGARRRLRIGAYGVLAESNHTDPSADFKISFDIIDTWKKEWSY